MRYFLGIFTVVLLGCSTKNSMMANSGQRSSNAEVATSAVVEEHFGIQVSDPYRWLEDMDSPRTQAWVQSQQKRTEKYLQAIPDRTTIKQKLEKVWDIQRYGVPLERTGKIFFSRKDGLQNQAVLYMANSLEAPPEVLLDPNTLSADGTISISEISLSEEGKFLAYALQGSGSDWSEIHVRDIVSKKDLPDILHQVRYSSIAWTKDSKGFYYSHYPIQEKTIDASGTKNQKVYFHTLGEIQSQDRLVLDRKDPDFSYSAEVTDDGKYAVFSIDKSTDSKNRVAVKDLSTDAPIRDLISKFEAEYDFVGNEGSLFYFRTNSHAPLGRMMTVDMHRPNDWKVLIPERKEKLETAHLIGGELILNYLKDAQSEVRIFTLKGKFTQRVALPDTGTASGFLGRQRSMRCFFSFESFSAPASIYQLDLHTHEVRLWKKPSLPFDTKQFQVAQTFYSSKDGTKIPIFIVHKKGITTPTPTLLEGYGGFNISITPSFSPEQFVWVELGGVLAVANIRGGGEYGEKWHRAGMLAHKQNVFDDFIAAADFLVKDGYTTKAQLGISGSSNGGLLVGAVLTQRPDLFGAALPGVGVLDMLRFQKFTVGWAWQDEYGHPDTNKKEFQNLLSYSPYHHIKKGSKYPATLIYTADHDDRVVPMHSYKFAAALEQAQGGESPILLRVDQKAGHGSGMPTSKRIQGAVDRLSFLVKNLGLKIQSQDVTKDVHPDISIDPSADLGDILTHY